MNTKELIAFIRATGCKVRIYKDRAHFSDGSYGLSWYDPERLIEVATKDREEEEINEILVHEYCHYLQWQDGLINKLRLKYGLWDVLEKWIEGGRVNKKKAESARKGVLLLEYDCELRTLEFLRTHKVKCNGLKEYRQGINSYLHTIKMSFQYKKKLTGYPRYKFSSILPANNRELFAPIKKGRGV